MRKPALTTLTTLSLTTIALLAVSCKTGPAEPEPTVKDPAAKTTATATTTTTTATTAGGGGGGAAGASKDPHNGSYSLTEATKDLKGSGPIVATIATSLGTLECRLFDDKAPVTVANFIGLATGNRAWRDPKTNTWVNRPAYDGTVFHRIIKGFMIQGGDPKGNGSGEPGYVIKDEIWPGAKHDRAGLLCMANRGPNTNGAQFFVTDAVTPHLDNGYTIFGECAPVDVVHKIANVPTGPMDAPKEPVTITKVTISRDEKKK